MKANTAKAMKRRGSTLLMGLLVLSTVFIITMSVAEITHTELLIARTTDNVTVATYATEASLEEGVYRMRKVPGTLVSDLDGDQLTLENNASWDRVARKSEPSGLFLPYLVKDRGYGFDLYDPESGLAAGKNSLVITPYCTTDKWLEIGFTAFAPGSAFNENFTKYRYPCPGFNTGTQQYDPIIVNAIAGANSYRMYIRAVNGDVGGARILACDQPNGQGTCDMPGRVSITATGAYQNARRALSISMPRLAPVSGIFSYAIFTECSLIKDVSTYPVPPPPCP